MKNPIKDCIVKRTEGRALKFKGEVLAEVATSTNNASPNYSGSTGHWTELTLWRTLSGLYVGRRYNGTQWQGENDYSKVEVLKDTEAVFKFFGEDRLAQELYEQAGLEFVEVIN